MGAQWIFLNFEPDPPVYHGAVRVGAWILEPTRCEISFPASLFMWPLARHLTTQCLRVAVPSCRNGYST